MIKNYLTRVSLYTISFCFVLPVSLITLVSYSSVMCSITEQKQKMNEREWSSREIGRKGKKPQALQQYFSVKDKVISTLPSGANNPRSISNSHTHRSVFFLSLKLKQLLSFLLPN